MSSLPSTWQEWYNEPMNSSTNFSDLFPADNVECVMWGVTDPASHGTSDVAFEIAAFGEQYDVARISETDYVVENGVFWFHETDVNPEVVGFSIWYNRHSYGTYGGYEDSAKSIDIYAMKWRLGSSEGIRGMDPDARKVVMFGPCNTACADYHFGPDCVRCDGEDMFYNGADCIVCPVGYRKDANVCLPTLQAVFWERTAPWVYVSLLEGNVLEVLVRVDKLPDAIHGGVSVAHRIDLGPTKAALQFDSPCSQLWTESFSSESSYSFWHTTVSSASSDCSFNETIEGAYVKWSAFVAVFVLADSGVAAPAYIRPLDLSINREVGQIFEGENGWGFRTLTSSAQTVTINGPSSTLQIFRSSDYASPMKEAFFNEGDDIFVEHKLDGAGHGFTIESRLVWLSTSFNPDGQVGLVHDLTAEVGSIAGLGGIRYRFKAKGEGCEEDCWLHSLSQVVEGSVRRLQIATLALTREADLGDNYTGASVGLTISRLTTPSPDYEDQAEVEPDLHEFRHPGVIIVAAVAIANVVAWPTLLCILSCHDAHPLGLPPDQQRYRILRDHSLTVLMMDLLRLVLGVASFVAAWHFKELEATSDPDVMLRGLLVFASLGGFLFVVEATGWTFWRRSESCVSLQHPKSLVLLASLYLLLADVPTVVVYAGIALFGWLDGSFPWVSTLGVVFAILLLVVKFVALRLATSAAEQAASTARGLAGIPGEVPGCPDFATAHDAPPHAAQ